MDQAKTTQQNYQRGRKSTSDKDLPKSFHDPLWVPRHLATENLPKTFQDAIQVCYKLGIQYLWIDSLCIIQDDSGDWQHESAKMAAVYQDAFITLAATGSSSCTKGLNFSLERRHFSQFSAIKGWGDLEGLRRQPLYQRGWTLQETVLSRRVVHFATDQLYFICRSGSESGQGHGLGNVPSLPSHNSSPGDPGYEIWWDWIEDYSGRQLTKAQDKLPALAGLTKIYQQITGADPAVGLWKNDIHYGLLWRRAPGNRESGRQPGIPTWSWASLNGPVLRSKTPRDEFMRQIFTTPPILTLYWQGEELTSGIKEAEIRVEGRLKRMADLDPKTIEVSFDEGRPSPDQSNLWCLQLEQSKYGHGKIHFLVLRRRIDSQHPHQYTRVGVGCHDLSLSTGFKGASGFYGGREGNILLV